MSGGRFERMVGISEEEYQHLKSLQRSQDPVQNKFLSLSNEYKKQGSIDNPYVRNQRQGETLGQMINLKENLRQRLVDATPRPYKSRVQSLFQFVSDKVNVNARGEVYDKAGAIIEDSNIADLIQHAVRDRRRNITPPGWSNFLELLKENNAPRMILNYDTLDEMHFKGVKPPSNSAKVKLAMPSKLSEAQINLPSRIPMLKKSPESSVKTEPKVFFDPERRSKYFVPLKDEKLSKKMAVRKSSRSRKQPEYLNPGKGKGKGKGAPFYI